MTVENLQLHLARKLAKSLILAIKNQVVNVSIVGSTRRWKPTVGGIDILAAVPAAVKAQEAVKREFSSLGQPTIKGDSVFVQVPMNGKVIRAVLHLCGEKNWGASLLYYTGNEEHSRFVAKNLKLCADLVIHPSKGVCTQQGEATRFRTEREIYNAASLPYFPPECREHNVIPPDLFTPEKYQSDYCVRSLHGGGSGTVDACIRAARANDLKVIAIGDRLDMLSDPKAYLRSIEEAKRTYPGMKVYASLDLPVGIDGYIAPVPTRRLDFISVSLYREPTTNPEMRVLTAMDLDPRVKVVYGAHLSTTKEWKRVFLEMARRNVALGLDPRPEAEVSIDAIRSAQAAGVKFVMSSGAYDPKNIGRVVYAEKRARRALLTNQDLAWSPAQ